MIVDDEETNHFVVPSAPALYRTWVRALGAVTLSTGDLGLVSRDDRTDGLRFGFGTYAVGCLPLAPEVVRMLWRFLSSSSWFIWTCYWSVAVLSFTMIQI